MTTHNPAQGSGIIVLLIDDQAIIGEAVRRMLASESDIEYHYCSNPTKAIQEVERLRPTVILQDLVMPEIDGMSLVVAFRENEIAKEIPLIVLSTKEEPKIKAESFAKGANDYLVKLPDKVELIARIRHHSKGYINLLERIAAHQALERSQKALAQELQEASDYVRSLLPAPMEGSIASDWRFKSSSSLGGDAFGHHWVDGEHLLIYLLDVCGHGVGAALLSISVMNVLRSQTLPHVDFKDPASILTGLNQAFPMESHNFMYFTMWCGVYHPATGSMTYASAGHPPSILFTPPTSAAPSHACHELRTPQMGIGCFPDSQYQSESIAVPPGSLLYLFSDGVYELTDGSGKDCTLEEFVQFLASLNTANHAGLDDVVRFAAEYQGSDHFEDDFSILKILF